MPSEHYVVSVHLTPHQASQGFSMVRYTTVTATEIFRGKVQTSS